MITVSVQSINLYVQQFWILIGKKLLSSQIIAVLLAVGAIKMCEWGPFWKWECPIKSIKIMLSTKLSVSVNKAAYPYQISLSTASTRRRTSLIRISIMSNFTDNWNPDQYTIVLEEPNCFILWGLYSYVVCLWMVLMCEVVMTLLMTEVLCLSTDHIQYR